MLREKRLDWLDIARGIGIIFVVSAHTLIPQIRANSRLAEFLWIFIYNFHMPLFFFISGFLFERNLLYYRNKYTTIVSKAKYLVLPYVVFSVLAYLAIFTAMHLPPLASVLNTGGYHITDFKSAVLQILFYNHHADQHLWFAYSLFLVFVVNILFSNLLKSKIFLVILLALYISKAYIHYFGILNYTAGDLIFFSLARIMYSNQRKLKPSALSGIAVLFVVTSGIYSFFYITQMPQSVLKGVIYFIRFISSVSGIVTVCSISHILSESRLRSFFSRLGTYSYDIYLMHAPFLVSGLMGILTVYTPLHTAICSLIVLLTGLFVPYVLSRFIIRKIPLLSVPLLGKRYI